MVRLRRLAAVLACLLLIASLSPSASLARATGMAGGEPAERALGVGAAGDVAQGASSTPVSVVTTAPNPIAHLPVAKSAEVASDRAPELGFGKTLTGNAAGSSWTEPTVPAPKKAVAVDRAETPPAPIVSAAGTADPLISTTIAGTIADSGGNGVSGVYVYVYDATWTIVTYAPTAFDGTYLLSAPSGTSYEVGVTSLNGTYPNGYYSTAGWVPHKSLASSFFVGSSGVTGIDILLPAWVNVTGTVTNGDGTPIGGIWTCIVAVDTCVSAGGTDATGNFSLRVGAGADYFVKFSDNQQHDYQTGWYSASGFVGDAANATSVHAGASGASGVTVTMPLNPSITGTITNSASGGVSGAIVTITAKAPGGNWLAYKSVATDSSGGYSMRADAGTYRLYVSDPSDGHPGGYYSVSGHPTSFSNSDTLTLTPAGLSNIDLQMLDWVYIRGRVTDTHAAPVGGIDVYVDAGGYAATTTASNGTYALRVNPDSSYRVGFGDNGIYIGGWIGASGLVTNVEDAKWIPVAETDVTGVDAVLQLHAQIKGRVTNASGTGVAGIKVTALGSSGNETTSRTTAADGTYAMPVPPDTYTVEFSDPNLNYITGYYGSSGFVRDAVDAAHLTVGMTGDRTGVDVVAQAYVKLTGRVVNAAGSGVGGIAVRTYFGNDITSFAVTDSTGNYVLRFLDPVSSQQLYFGDDSNVYRGGWYTAAGLVANQFAGDQIAVPSSGRVINLTLPKWITVSGRITNASGAGVGSATVAVLNARETFTEQTASDGTYSIQMVTGDYEMRVSGTSLPTVWYGNGTAVYDSGAASVLHIGLGGASASLRLPNWVYIRGRITSTTGAAISNAEIDGFRFGAQYATTGTFPDGTYMLAVVPGTYTIGIYGHDVGYSSGWYGTSGFAVRSASARTITVGTSDVTGIDLHVPAERWVLGTSMNGTGAVLSSTYVEAFVEGEYYSSGVTGSDGKYAVPVAPGAVTLWFYDLRGAWAPGWYRSGSVTATASAATAITVATKDVASINVRLPKPGFITGTSYYTASDASVLAYAADGSTASFGLLDGNGKFKMPVLPGTYKLWLDAGKEHRFAFGWYRATTGFTADAALASSVSVASAGTAAVALKPPVVHAVQGHVTDMHGIGLAAANDRANAIVIAAVNGSAYVSAAADATGSYSLYLPTGTYGIGAYDVYGSYADGWYGTNGAVSYLSYATLVTTPTYDLPGIDIALPMKGAPGAPASAAARGYDSSALVTWSLPRMVYGADPVGYTVTASPGGATCSSGTARFCTVAGLMNGTPYTFTVRARNTYGTGPASPASAPVTPAAATGARFVAVTPNRLVDSRTEARLGLAASLTAGTPATFQVTGRVPADAGRNIPTNAIAVTGNLTVVRQTAAGFLALTPTVPSGTPSTSTLNFPIGDVRANAVTVPLGPGGKLTVTYVSSTKGAKTDVVFDVTGYFTAASTGARFVAVTPSRLVDSRTESHVGLSASLSAGKPAIFRVTNRATGDSAKNVPTNAIAVTGNLTVVRQTAAGYLALTPTAPSGTPTTSTLNFPLGDVRANAVTVPLGSGGTLAVTYTTSTKGAKTDVVFDVTGYFVPGNTGATYFTVAPNRLVDSRSSARLGLGASLRTKVAAKFQVASRSGDPAQYVPVKAVAVTGNLTVVGQTAPGYLALTPTVPAGVPDTSSLNFPIKDVRANAVTVPLGSGGTLSVMYVSSTTGATTDVVFDVTGYFAN